MQALWNKHRKPLIGFAIIWLLFALMDLAQDYYFSSQWPGLRKALVSLYVFLPWWLISAFAGLVTIRFTDDTRSLAGIQLALAILFALIHVGLLASRYWIFWPEAVASHSFGFIYGEQFFKWFQFELLAYAACSLFWYAWIRAANTERFNSPLPGSISLQTDEGVVMVNLDEIEWLRADNNYVIVYAPPGEYRIRATLQSMVRKMHSGKFLQTHRSAAVNVDRAIKIEQARVELRSGARAPLSRRRRARLLDMLDSRTA